MKLWLRRFCILLLTLAFACGAIWLLFRNQYDTVIQDLAKTQVINSTSDLINDAISDQIAQGNVEYDRIVYFEKDLNGRITALKTNISEVNRLKTDILNIINDAILSQNAGALGVPIGSLIMPEILSGKGPEFPVQIMAIRNSDASFDSSFTQAGINQTLHQLHMEVVVDVTVLVLGRTFSLTVSTNMVIAETVIVGDVPDTFFQTGG